MAATFSSRPSGPTHTPVRPFRRRPSMPNSAQREDQRFLDVAHVLVHVAPVGLQVEDGIADQLTGTVIGDVAAAAGFEHRDAFAARASGDAMMFVALPRVRTPSVMTGGCSSSSSVSPMAPLAAPRPARPAAPGRRRLDEPEPAYINRARRARRRSAASTARRRHVTARQPPARPPRPHGTRVRSGRAVTSYIHDSSKSCSRSFSACRNRPASAPSIRRWS